MSHTSYLSYSKTATQLNCARLIGVMGKMTEEIGNCPICGSSPSKYTIDKDNLQFLKERTDDGQINAVITLSRIVWNYLPQLRLTADQKTIVDQLSKSVLEDFRKRADDMLTSMRNLVETFSNVSKELPADLRDEYKNTMVLFEHEFEALRESAPTFENVVKAIEIISKKVEEATQKNLNNVEKELGAKFKQILDKMGFPEPEQLKLLAQLIPPVLPLLQELLRLQKVPSEKGELGELEIVEQLANFYPEDEYEHLGKPGDTDILIKPRFNGMYIGHTLLIESKKNNSGWKRTYVHQVRKHMKLRNQRFAILAVEVMPRSANGFMTEHHPEGAITITSIQNFYIAYGAVRSALIALAPFDRGNLDIQKLFADKRIEEAIHDAYQYQDKLRKIRVNARKIERTAKGITEDADELDDCLKQSLRELQQRINNAVTEIASQNKVGGDQFCL